MQRRVLCGAKWKHFVKTVGFLNILLEARHTLSAPFDAPFSAGRQRCVLCGAAGRASSLWAAELVPYRPKRQRLPAKANSWITTSGLQGVIPLKLICFGALFQRTSFTPRQLRTFPRVHWCLRFPPTGCADMFAGHTEHVRLISSVCVPTSSTWQHVTAMKWNQSEPAGRSVSVLSVFGPSVCFLIAALWGYRQQAVTSVWAPPPSPSRMFLDCCHLRQ